MIAIPGKQYKHLATNDKYECRSYNRKTGNIVMHDTRTRLTVNISDRDFREKFGDKC